MKARIQYVLAPLFALLLAVPVAFAQTEALAPEVPAFTQQELDQMLAPIALYPDSLLSQMLMASTYPLEVVEAARWSRANSHLVGEQAVRAVEERYWDPSVKSLVAFPNVLNMMDEKLEWTERLGDAYLAQPSQVMDTVQSLRRKAYAAGHLRSSDHYSVAEEGSTIVVQSPYPDVIYVPYYDPFIVYGAWWWPAYPPIYWAPWPGYYAYPGFVGFRWSVAIVIGPRFFFGSCDWSRRQITVVNVNTFYFQQVVHRQLPPGHVWKHDPDHRRGVVYRHPTVKARFVRTDTAHQVRREIRAVTPSMHEPRIESLNQHSRRDDVRPGHVNLRQDDRRGPPQKVDSRDQRLSAGDIPSRVRAPVERPELKRPDMPAPVARPDPVERPPIHGGRSRGQEQRDAHGRVFFNVQGGAPDFDKLPISHSSGHGSARKLGDPHDFGESRHK